RPCSQRWIRGRLGRRCSGNHTAICAREFTPNGGREHYSTWHAHQPARAQGRRPNPASCGGEDCFGKPGGGKQKATKRAPTVTDRDTQWVIDWVIPGPKTVILNSKLADLVRKGGFRHHTCQTLPEGAW